MSSYNLPSPRRIVISNAEGALAHDDDTEPSVEVTSDTLESGEIFGGVMKRAIVGTTQFPAKNDEKHTVGVAPGSGITLPGGVHIYYLELAPGYTTPMHRTISQDYLVVQNGSPVLITPGDSFKIVDGKGTYSETQETVCNPGEVVIQRGAMHAWSNRSDEWIRMLGVVLDSETQKISSGTGKEEIALTESWI